MVLLRCYQIPATAGNQGQIVEARGNIEAARDNFFLDGQGLLVVLLRLIQIALSSNYIAQIVEAHGNFESARSQFLSDG